LTGLLTDAFQEMLQSCTRGCQSCYGQYDRDLPCVPDISAQLQRLALVHRIILQCSIMPELKSELSWSISRANLLRDCARRYYYHYYLSWEGWKPEASPARRKAYTLKLMLNLDMLAGQIVHEVIREIFDRQREGLSSVTCEQARKRAHTRLRDAWRQSKEQLWRRNPKRFANLFEHYYEHEVPRARLDGIREKVDTCITNLFGSEIFKSIQRAGVKHWLAIDQLDFFEFAGVKIYAVPDFALRDGQKVRIYDWKTGKPDENVERQLTCYALFANKRWHVPLDCTVPLAVYLRADQAEQVDVTEERAARLKDYIRTTLFEMMRLLRSVEHNLPRGIDAFSPSDDATQCARCFFQELCRSQPDQEEADLTLFG